MFLYRILSLLLVKLAILQSLRLILMGREDWADLRERLTAIRVQGRFVWIHGASLGELQAAHPLVTALAAYGVPLLVTSTTVTGRQAVRDWQIAGVTARLAPLDMAGVSRRNISHNDLAGLIVLENEIWPHRILACHHAGVPVALVNARMSAGTARGWGRFARLATRVLAPVACVVPQDDLSAQRLHDLGVTPVAMMASVNLKSLFAAKTGPVLAEGWTRAATVLAASTHDGEEAIVLQGFLRARARHPQLRLIIAPRHPARGAQIARLVQAAGIDAVLRREKARATAPVLIADTLGEMDLWYRSAGLVFVAGSLTNKGGHTPFEPAAYGCAILHGPDVTNHAEGYAALHAANAAILARDADEIAAGISTALSDAEMGKRAQAALKPAALAPVVARLVTLLKIG